MKINRSGTLLGVCSSSVARFVLDSIKSVITAAGNCHSDFDVAAAVYYSLMFLSGRIVDARSH